MECRLKEYTTKYSKTEGKRSTEEQITDPNREYIESKLKLRKENIPKEFNIRRIYRRKGLICTAMQTKKPHKRCYICNSAKHLKRSCPYDNCFYCGRPGHYKRTCPTKAVEKLNSLSSVTGMLQEVLKQLKELLNSWHCDHIQKEGKHTKGREIDDATLGKIRLVCNSRNDWDDRDWTIWYGKVRLGKYIGPPFQKSRLSMKTHSIPPDIMNEEIYSTLPLKARTLCRRLPHICACGELFNGNEMWKQVHPRRVHSARSNHQFRPTCALDRL